MIKTAKYPRLLAISVLLFLLAPASSGLAAAEAETGVLGKVSGEQIYVQICQGCHMSGGRGANGAGKYPAFVDNPAVASSPYMAVTILAGRRNMPAFAQSRARGGFFPPTWLTDQQVADVINYIRGNFGNQYRDQISAAEVRALQPPAPKGD